MVRFGERNHEFSCALVAGIDANSSLFDALRIHKGDQLEKEVRLRFKKIWRLAPHGGFKFLGVVTRNAVPSLRLTPVHYEIVR